MDFRISRRQPAAGQVEIIGLVPAAHRPEILWAWILRVCYESWMLEKRPPPLFGVIQDQICQARNGIQAANTYRKTARGRRITRDRSFIIWSAKERRVRLNSFCREVSEAVRKCPNASASVFYALMAGTWIRRCPSRTYSW